MEQIVDENEPLSLIELEARLFRQEHRLSHLLYNYFHRRKKFVDGDIRRKACSTAFYLRLVTSLLPIGAATTIGITSIAALLISLNSLNALKHQNTTEARSGIFEHSMSIQNIWVEHPQLRPYFYDNLELPEDKNSDDYIRLMIISEMLADMLDHVISVDAEQFAKEGWDDYAQDLYDNSAAFRVFIDDPTIRTWYPYIGNWITYSDET